MGVHVCVCLKYRDAASISIQTLDVIQTATFTVCMFVFCAALYVIRC